MSRKSVVTVADPRLYRYIEKFYGMRSQLQKISLRLQVRNRWYCDDSQDVELTTYGRADLPDE